MPRLKMPPTPFQPNTWHLQANEPVTEQLHATIEAMLSQMNRAIDLLPDLTHSTAPADLQNPAAAAAAKKG